MAIYDYVCPKDGAEKSVSIPLSEYSSTKVVKCPKCQKKMRRHYSPPSVSIK